MHIQIVFICYGQIHIQFALSETAFECAKFNTHAWSLNSGQAKEMKEKHTKIHEILYQCVNL